jgi:hypothetical protein
MSVLISPRRCFVPRRAAAYRPPLAARRIRERPRRLHRRYPVHPYASPLPIATERDEPRSRSCLCLDAGPCSRAAINGPRHRRPGIPRARTFPADDVAGLIGARPMNRQPYDCRSCSAMLAQACEALAWCRQHEPAGARSIRCCSRDLLRRNSAACADAAFGRLQMAVQSGLSRAGAYEKCRYTSTKAPILCQSCTPHFAQRLQMSPLGGVASTQHVPVHPMSSSR